MKLSKPNAPLKLRKVSKSLLSSGVDEFTIDQRGVLRNNHGVVSVSFSPCTVVSRNIRGGDTLIFHRCKKKKISEKIVLVE